MQLPPLILGILYHGRRAYQFIVRPITLGVRVMLVREGQVLLVRHSYMKGWYLPGGGLKRGETLETAVRREAREEAGVRMGALTLLGAFTSLERSLSDHNMLFLCTDFEQIGQHDSEIAEVKMFALAALPSDTLPEHRRRIEAYEAAAPAPSFGMW